MPFDDPEAPEVLEAVLNRMRSMTREEWQAELAWRPENARETWRTGANPMTFDDLSAANKALHLADLAKANADRCNEVYHPINDWSPTDWACALAGEAGECCNLVKKGRWLSADPADWPPELIDAILKEAADAVIYADLLAQRLKRSLGDAIREKFNAVSEEAGSDIRI